MRERPTSIDLFCGAGGMTLGFEQAGFDVAAAFDLEQFNVDTHLANFPNTSAFPVNLSGESGSTLRKMAGLSNTEVDVVFGGPPCQGFSYGGRQDVNDARNSLIFDFARIVRDIEPKYFVMENVKGLMSDRSLPLLNSFVRRMKRSGYSIVEPIRVLNAADYGVPQRRWRTFVLGSRKDLPTLAYPEPRGCCAGDVVNFYPVVRDAISDLPTLESRRDLFDVDEYVGTMKRTTNPYALLMRGIVVDPTSRAVRQPRCPDALTGCLRTTHSTETIRRFNGTLPGMAEPISRYIRLHWNDVSPTIRAGTGTDRGSHTAPRPIHPSVPRCISAREAARLHSFPDWFRFHGTRWHDFRQIGNSVPPLLAQAVASSVYSALNAQ